MNLPRHGEIAAGDRRNSPLNEAVHMSFIPVIVNALVICVISAELIAVFLNMVSADQLLVSSAISGLLTLLSFKLSKDALEVINSVPDSPDEQAGTPRLNKVRD